MTAIEGCIYLTFYNDIYFKEIVHIPEVDSGQVLIRPVLI